MLKEWPLVAFTILGQTAVGAFLMLSLPFFLAGPVSEDSRQFLLINLAFILEAVAVATALSLFHLGHPVRARRVLANFRTSWLSREIFFVALFGALVAAEFLFARFGAAFGLIKIVHVFAGLAGFFFLLSMIKLYMLETLPLWNHAATPLSFTLASLILGALSAGIIGGYFFYWGLGLLFVFLDLLLMFFFAPGHGLFIRRGGATVRPPAAFSRGLHWTSLGLEAGGLALVFLPVLAPIPEVSGVAVLALFSLMVLGALVIRRFLFYGLTARPGG